MLFVGKRKVYWPLSHMFLPSVGKLMGSKIEKCFRYALASRSYLVPALISQMRTLRPRELSWYPQGSKAGIRTTGFWLWVLDISATFFLLWWYGLAWIHRSDYFCLIFYFASFSVPDTVQPTAFWAGWLPGFVLRWHWSLWSKDVRLFLPQSPCDHS